MKAHNITSNLKILNSLHIDNDTDVRVFWCPGFLQDSSDLKPDPVNARLKTYLFRYLHLRDVSSLTAL